MLDIPRWLLAGSVLKPAGQTLLVGDHRQLSVVSETEWDDILRKPIEETNAYLSALKYVLWLDEEVGAVGTATATSASASTDGGSQQSPSQQPPTDEASTHQSRLSGFLNSDSTQHNEGDKR
jgi:hypothetical protein